MKFRWKALIAAALMAVAVATFVGCGKGKTPEGGSKDDYGTLTIEDVKVCITSDRAYTFAELNPVFSKPDKAEQLTYTYSTD